MYGRHATAGGNYGDEVKWAIDDRKILYATDEVRIDQWDSDSIPVIDPNDISSALQDAAAEERARPPSSALLSALLPATNSEDVIANLNELFGDRWVQRHGPKTARRIWVAQAVQMVLLQWAAPILTWVDKVRGLLRLF